MRRPLNIGARTLIALAVIGRDTNWLTRQSGLSANTIARLLRDPLPRPRRRTLDAVTRLLGVSENWLVAEATGRTLTSLETEELERCTKTLRSIARGERIDPRSDPNATLKPARRVPHSFRSRGARLVCRVRGASLARFGLLDGDTAYVRPTESIRQTVGSIVLFRLNGLLYLKRLTVAKGGVATMLSGNDGYDPLTIDTRDEFRMVGQVVACVREM
jgi:SOS-response transcriptional repressor LexA